MSMGKYYIIEVFEDGTSQFFKAEIDQRDKMFLGRVWSKVRHSLDTMIAIQKDIQEHKGE